MSATPNPWVYMDFSIGGETAGRVVFELRNDIAPVASENFRSLCTGWKGNGRFDKPLHYKNNRVHRCIPDRLLMAGDIITQDGKYIFCIFCFFFFLFESFCFMKKYLYTYQILFHGCSFSFVFFVFLF